MIALWNSPGSGTKPVRKAARPDEGFPDLTLAGDSIVLCGPISSPISHRSKILTGEFLSDAGE